MNPAPGAYARQEDTAETMNITELISPQRVVARLGTTSKKRALEQLAELLAGHAPSLTPEEIFDSLIGRERLGSTGLGQGVALPHGRLAGLSEPVGAFASLDPAIDFDAIDHQPVDLMFALLVPAESTDEHLQILADLARRFSDKGFTDDLRRAATGEELYQRFLTQDARQRESA